MNEDMSNIHINNTLSIIYICTYVLHEYNFLLPNQDSQCLQFKAIIFEYLISIKAHILSLSLFLLKITKRQSL